jgi:hypothetical protein
LRATSLDAGNDGVLLFPTMTFASNEGVGVGMFGFTLSWDEIARSSQAMGDFNTLPLELQGLIAGDRAGPRGEVGAEGVSLRLAAHGQERFLHDVLGVAEVRFDRQDVI